MRRAHAILVILALLAAPLALVVRAAGGDMAGCNRMCCLSHGSQASHSHRPAQRSMAQGSFCHRGAADKDCGCSMKASNQHVDYGFLAPIVPTTTSVIASVAIPQASRQVSAPRSDSIATRFLSSPFKPPRA
jgi:hypothetical protein